MGMFPVRIDERHVVRVKDPATGPDGVHYWLHLMEGADDAGLNGKSVAYGSCVLPWDILHPGDGFDEDMETGRFEECMARGFAAAILRPVGSNVEGGS